MPLLKRVSFEAQLHLLVIVPYIFCFIIHSPHYEVNELATFKCCNRFIAQVYYIFVPCRRHSSRTKAGDRIFFAYRRIKALLAVVCKSCTCAHILKLGRLRAQKSPNGLHFNESQKCSRQYVTN